MGRCCKGWLAVKGWAFFHFNKLSMSTFIGTANLDFMFSLLGLNHPFFQDSTERVSYDSAPWQHHVAKQCNVQPRAFAKAQLPATSATFCNLLQPSSCNLLHRSLEVTVCFDFGCGVRPGSPEMLSAPLRLCGESRFTSKILKALCPLTCRQYQVREMR